jgi:hypothetical protein
MKKNFFGTAKVRLYGKKQQFDQKNIEGQLKFKHCLYITVKFPPMQRNILSLILVSGSVSLMMSCAKTDIKPTISENGTAGVLAGRSDNNNNTTTYYGPVVQMGNGQIRSFGVLDKQTNAPVSIGMEITQGALNNLPGGTEETSYAIALHPTVASTSVFTHLVADWNPNGHQPGPYLLPHFDCHFYMISQATRLDITADDPKSVAPIPAGYLPDYYIGPLGPEPQMGGHCVDVTSPELNGSIFTHTFIYGAYDSKVAFYEPMVTRDYLLNGAGGTFNIKQPAKFSKAGYYPTKYSITKDAAGTRYVVLSDFVYRNAN